MYHGFDSESGVPIPDRLTAVCACDGDLSQINNIKETAKKLNDLKICANKQNAARSGVEQPADLAKVFMIIKSLLPDYTATNLPADRNPVKCWARCSLRPTRMSLSCSGGGRDWCAEEHTHCIREQGNAKLVA